MARYPLVTNHPGAALDGRSALHERPGGWGGVFDAPVPLDRGVASLRPRGEARGLGPLAWGVAFGSAASHPPEIPRGGSSTRLRLIEDRQHPVERSPGIGPLRRRGEVEPEVVLPGVTDEGPVVDEPLAVAVA